MAANATFALKPGVWFLRVRFVIFAPDSRREPSPPSGRKSTQPTVQILEASSIRPWGCCAEDRRKLDPVGRMDRHIVHRAGAGTGAICGPIGSPQKPSARK